jgi:hypothetical protein
MDIDELMGLHRQGKEMTDEEKEFVQELYAMETSGIWPHYRMRDGAGASFEGRLPPATPRRETVAYEQKAALNGSLDIQTHFAEEYGVTEITHEEWQQIEEGINHEGADFQLPFEVEGTDGETYQDVTVEELKYGSERIEPFLNVLEENLADYVGSERAAEWRNNKESQEPMYHEFENQYHESGLEEAVRKTKVNSQISYNEIEGTF